MIDRGPHERQPDGDVDARLEAEDLDRPVSLVVIVRHHQIEIAPPRAEEERVRGQRSLDVDAVLARGGDGRLQLLLFLAATEEPVLSGVRVDSAQTDARPRDARADQRVVSAPDGPPDEARLDLRDGVDETDVGRHVDDPDLRRGEHHRHFLGAGELRQ